MLSRSCRLFSSFSGRPLIFSLTSTPSSSFSSIEQKWDLFNPTSEHRTLRQTMKQFTTQEVEPQALEYNRTETFNIPLFRKCGELGILGITVDEDVGGSGMDAIAAAIVHEELSASDPAFCLSYLAHSMLFANNLNINGSNDLRRRYLPAACTGEKIGGMGMSEPGAGTDVLSLQTRAVLSGDHYVLNGSKMWITNGAVSDTELGDVFLIYARTGTRSRDISLFVVEKGFEGFSLGQRIKNKCGMRASATAELLFENCRVPKENLVGKEGSAVLHMMRNLEIERLTLAAMALGIARRSLEVMIRYSNDRKAFGQSIVGFGQIQKAIGTSYAKYMAGRSYVYDLARRIDLKQEGQRIDSDGVKHFCSTMSKEVADQAMQVLGGYGYVGDYVVERLWRDAKLLEIGGGTSEAHEKNMAKDLSAKLPSFTWDI